MSSTPSYFKCPQGHPQYHNVTVVLWPFSPKERNFASWWTCPPLASAPSETDWATQNSAQTPCDQTWQIDLCPSHKNFVRHLLSNPDKPLNPYWKFFRLWLWYQLVVMIPELLTKLWYQFDVEIRALDQALIPLCWWIWLNQSPPRCQPQTWDLKSR